MINVLQSKRDSSRFQILVEIAAHQPNLRQKEVAESLDLTTQAISEYIKELVAEGLVTTHGRTQYSVTKKGMEWLLETAAEIKRYAAVVMEEVISHVPVWTALAEIDLEEGEQVSLKMRNGFLYASKKEGAGASGRTISSALAGEDVGISDLMGMIDLEGGKITIARVPRILFGGSGKVDIDVLSGLLSGNEMIGCLGIEALIAIRKAGREPDIIFGARESAVEAAHYGISSVLVSLDEQIPRILERLQSEGLKYKVVDLTLA